MKQPLTCSVSNIYIMASYHTSELGREWNLISRKLQKCHQCESRVWFLGQCLKFNIVPATLRVMAPKNQPSQDPKTSNQYENVAHSVSIKNLRIAYGDAKKCATKEQTNCEDFTCDILRGLASDQIKCIQNRIDAFVPQLKRKLKKRYHKKLCHLKAKYHIPIDSDNRIPGLEVKKHGTKSRRFIRRSRYQRLKQKEARKQNLNLVQNLSDFKITGPMDSLLNHGLGFVPTPKTVNITEVQSQLDRYDRTMKWREYFFEKDENTNEDSVPSIFKAIKTNLPPERSPPLLQMFLGAVRSDILGSCR